MKRRKLSLRIFYHFIMFFAQALIYCAALEAAPFQNGETIRFDIKNFGIKAGEATLVLNGPVQLGSRQVLLITFTANALHFFDEEKIYVDPATYYPIAVHRNLDLWGKKEKIVEEYDTQKGTVRIYKEANGKTSTMAIEKKGQLDNIYAFLYRYRQGGQFEVGENHMLNLPTVDIKIQLVKLASVKTSDDKEHLAYFLESNPSKYKIWFAQTENRIPLRLDGSVGFGKTYLVLSSYQEN